MTNLFDGDRDLDRAPDRGHEFDRLADGSIDPDAGPVFLVDRYDGPACYYELVPQFSRVRLGPDAAQAYESLIELYEWDSGALLFPPETIADNPGVLSSELETGEFVSLADLTRITIRDRSPGFGAITESLGQLNTNIETICEAIGESLREATKLNSPKQ